MSDRVLSRRAFLTGLALPLVGCDSQRPRAGFLGAMERWDARAEYVELRSFDVDREGRAYYSSWDRASALHPQTLLAYGMNGERLAPGHGAPLRLYSAVKLGYKMVKYLTEVSFLPRATGGY